MHPTIGQVDLIHPSLDQVVSSITDVLRVIAPLIVYFLITFFFTIFICKRSKVSYALSTTQGLTASSNNFEVSPHSPAPRSARMLTQGYTNSLPLLLQLLHMEPIVRKLLLPLSVLLLSELCRSPFALRSSTDADCFLQGACPSWTLLSSCLVPQACSVGP